MSKNKDLETIFKNLMSQTNNKDGLLDMAWSFFHVLLDKERDIFLEQNNGIYNPIFIRLHPSLKSEKAIYELKEIEGIPDQINLKFIDHKKENILSSMKKSNYCIFGLSTYINLAIDLKCNVIGVETNHINSIPTNSDFVKSPYLKIINPW